MSADNTASGCLCRTKGNRTNTLPIQVRCPVHDPPAPAPSEPQVQVEWPTFCVCNADSEDYHHTDICWRKRYEWLWRAYRAALAATATDGVK